MRVTRVARALRAVIVPAIVAALVAFPLGVLASHSFSDVPTNHPFHADIAALKDSGVSPTGCGGGKFCPDDFVTRGQMAAFLNRLGALGPGKVPVANATKLDGLDSTAFLQGDVLRISHSVAAPATNIPSTWFTAEFTQPAGYALASLAAEATVTVPSACLPDPGYATITVYLDARVNPALYGSWTWTAETANLDEAIETIDQGYHLVAPASPTTRTVTVKISDSCTGGPHFTFKAFALDLVFAR